MQSPGALVVQLVVKTVDNASMRGSPRAQDKTGSGKIHPAPASGLRDVNGSGHKQDSVKRRVSVADAQPRSNSNLPLLEDDPSCHSSSGPLFPAGQHESLYDSVANTSSQPQLAEGSLQRTSVRMDPSDGGSRAPIAVALMGKAKSTDNVDEEGVVINLPFTVYPGSTWYRVFWFVCVLTSLLSAVTEPFEVAFIPQPTLWPYNDCWAVFAYLGFAVFSTDMALKFFLAYQDVDTKELVTSPQRISIHYLKGMFWVDFVATFPFEEIVCGALGLQDSTGSLARYICILRFLRLIRMYRVFEFFHDLEHDMILSQIAIMIIRNFTYLLYTSHWAACVYWLIAELAHFAHVFPHPPPFSTPSHPALPSAPGMLAPPFPSMEALATTNPVSWVGRHYERVEGQPLIVKYIYSFYLVMTTLSSMGDSDFFAANVAESIFTICFLLLCFVLSAYMLGSVSVVVVRSDRRNKVYRDRVNMLKQYSQQHHLPLDLLSSMQEHMELHFQSEYSSDDHVLGIYPSALRRKVLRHMYLQPVRSCYLLKGCKQKFLDAVMAAGRVELFTPGVQIFAPGDIVNELFIIVSGEVETESASFLGAGVTGGGKTPRGKREDSAHQTVDGPQRSAGSVFASTFGLQHSRGSEAGGYRHSPSMRNASMRSASFGQARASLLSERDGDSSNASSTAMARSSQLVWLKSSDPVAEVSFFTEIPSDSGYWSVAITRVLVLTRPAYEGLAAAFPHQMRLLLENLQQRAEEDLQADMEDACNAQLLSQHDLSMFRSFTVKGQPVVNAEERLNQLFHNGKFTPHQEAALKHLRRIHATVRRYIMKVDQQRANDFLNAASAGDTPLVRTMLSQGMSLNAADYDRRTALMLACAKGNEAIVALLLELGADSTICDSFGNTAMFEACKSCHDGVIDVMLAGGAKLHMSGILIAAQMCTCVFEGNLSMLVRLLRAGADPDSCDYDKRCSLHIAAAEGNLTAIKTIIEKGATHDFQDRWGNTAMDEAQRCGAQLVIQYLDRLSTTRKPLDSLVAWRTHCTQTFLGSCFSGDASQMRFTLKSAPAGLAAGLMISAAHKRMAFMQELLAWGSSGSLQEEVGHAMLLSVALNGDEEVQQMLLASGARVVSAPHAERLGELLCHSATCDDAPTVRRLLRCGVAADLKDRHGNAALLAAAAEGNVDAVRALVEEGNALLDIVNPAGQTALQVAQEQGDRRLADYLVAAAAKRASRR